MVSAKVYGVHVFGTTRKAFPMRIAILGRMGKGEVAGALISHVGDLLISGGDAFIAYLSGRLRNSYAVKVF